MQPDGLVEVRLTPFALADAAAELVVHLAHVVRRAVGHSFEHEGVLGRNRQVFQLVAALRPLQPDSVVVGGLAGRCDRINSIKWGSDVVVPQVS